MRAAVEAGHAVDPAVQFDHVVAARPLMQAVDVLRDEAFDPARAAEPRQRDVRPVRPRAAHDRPADHAARPVAAPRGIGAEEFVKLDRRRAHPLTVAVAVTGNAGIGADARAGQHEQARMTLDERVQRIERGRIDVGDGGIGQGFIVHVGNVIGRAGQAVRPHGRPRTPAHDTERRAIGRTAATARPRTQKDARRRSATGASTIDPSG